MKNNSLRTLRLPSTPRRDAPPSDLERSRPRAFEEWKALRRWGQLSVQEAGRPGYLMRLAREEAGLTQSQLAQLLGVSQQAVARSERWQSNPTYAALHAWAAALDARLDVAIVLRSAETT